MEANELADLYFEAWNRQSVPDILRLMHPDATCFDAYWGEFCSGRDLVRYFTAELEASARWYRRDGDLIEADDCVVVRYDAYDRKTRDRGQPLYSGAEVMNIVDGRIMTISDVYCDPDPNQLRQMASYMDSRLHRNNVAHLGLTAKVSARIKFRLAELEDSTTVLLDPDLTASRLAEHVGCAVIHLFHVLEEEKGATFTEFVNEARVRYARSLLLAETVVPGNIHLIADQAGFADVEAFNDVFRSMVGVEPGEYSENKGTSKKRDTG